MKTATRLLIGGSLVAALAAGTLGFVAASAQDAPDYGALVKSLGAEEFAARTKAYEDLEKAGVAARKALEEGAKAEDEQVRWSAKRLLARLDGEERPARGVLRFGGDPTPMPGGPDIDRTFRDMDLRLEELGRRFRDLGQPGARIERHGISEQDGERLEARVDAEGRVTVKVVVKGADGKPVERSFEAKDMATLEKEHPEVAKKVKGLLGEVTVIAKPALGVTLSPVPPVLRTQLSIKDGEGVVVEEVLAETPAARMGLKRHDVILSVNGTAVAGVADVRDVLATVKEGGALALRILRGGKVEEIAGTR